MYSFYFSILAGSLWLVYSVMHKLLEVDSTPPASSPSMSVQQVIQGGTIVHILLWSEAEQYRVQLLVSWIILGMKPMPPPPPPKEEKKSIQFL